MSAWQSLLKLGRGWRPGSSSGKHVQRTVHRSSTVPDTILWEVWKVNPFYILPCGQGRQFLQGHESLELLSSNFTPLPTSLVDRARSGREWVLFRKHPRVEGALLLEGTVPCTPREIKLFRERSDRAPISRSLSGIPGAFFLAVC